MKTIFKPRVGAGFASCVRVIDGLRSLYNSHKRHLAESEIEREKERTMDGIL